MFPDRTVVSLASDPFFCTLSPRLDPALKSRSHSDALLLPLCSPPKPASSSANETSGVSDGPRRQNWKSKAQATEARGVRWICQGRRNPGLALSQALIGQKATIKQAELINEPLLSDGLESQSNWCGLPTIPWGDGNRWHDKRRWEERGEMDVSSTTATFMSWGIDFYKTDSNFLIWMSHLNFCENLMWLYYALICYFSNTIVKCVLPNCVLYTLLL